MEPDRWQRLWSIFHAALERPAGEARARDLDELCAGDPSLRAEVDSLLAAHGTGAEALPLGAEVASLGELAPGARIGPYRIERRIGEGGMGVVYEASQEAPVRRRVALKLVKLGMDTREVVRRFEAERQALALMEHGSIAKVFDAGSTPEGRPYFAMELVAGRSILEHCDDERLTLRARLALLVPVCRAVHHAHQKGVLHRDLKASNVLVTRAEGRPVPKVIDFGVARAVDEGGAGATLLTRHGQILGTPETMSPEQAGLGGDVDTRSDVYSLGVLLYELACGLPPFERGRESLTEVLRRVREEEPPPPSARLARARSEQAAAIAARRGSEPSRLRREIAGELDWIVGRAMAKERERRYGSAAELAEELERLLAGRPVAAGPPSRLYRLRKLVARHRFESAAVAALVVALALLGVSTSVQARRLARALASEERERAAATRVADFLVELLEQPDPAVARGREPTLREVLDRGAERVATELSGQSEIQARLLETIARVQANLGHYDEAEPALTRALELRRSLPGSTLEVAADLQKLGELDFERARYDSARARAEQALELRRAALGAEHPAAAESLHLRALVERQTGDLARAEALHRSALALQVATLAADDPALGEAWNWLGIVRRRRGDLAGAEAAYREALAIWRAGDAEHPRVAMAINNLALTVHLSGDYAEARRLFEELLPLRRGLLGEEHPDVQVTLANYAKLLHDAGELESAAAAYEHALAIGRRTLGGDHPQLASTMADHAAVLAKLGSGDEALVLAREALTMRRRIFGETHAAVASSLGYLAEVHAARGEPGPADRLHAESTALFRRTLGTDPRTAEALVAHGLFLLAAGEPARAEPLLAEAVALLRATLPAGDRRTARAESAWGESLVRTGRRREGEALLVSSLAALAALENPDTVRARARLDALRGVSR